MTAIAEDELIERALRSARDTKELVVRSGIRHETAAVFAKHFGSALAIIVADKNTFAAAGRDVSGTFARAGIDTSPPFIFDADVYAETSCVEQLQAVLATGNAIPIAVGSGTIND